MSYQIRLCRKEELHKLKKFLSQYWKPNHVFLNYQALLDWQHLEEEHYNFVVAHYDKTGEFHGVLGFISPGFFNRGNVTSIDDIWLAIWKVEKSIAVSNSIGIDLLKFIKDKYKPRTISAIGINNEVSFVYRLLGFRVGKLYQGYILNFQKEKYSIAQISKKITLRYEEKNTDINNIAINKINSNEIKKINIEQLKFNRFFGINYIINRFINHPCYKYYFYIVKRNDLIISLFVTRIVKILNTQCLRIVDFWGLENIDEQFFFSMQRIIGDEDFEYVDVIASPTDFEIFENAGFKKNTDDSFVPHLFEPLELRRSEIMFATNSIRELSMFKADSDLDRPNLIGDLWGK